MRVYIGVKNFGKIRSAEINISNFTVFVGNNNSGKTYMMQLIYGVLDVLRNFQSHTKPLDCEIGKVYKLKSEIVELQDEINQYLEKNKERIVMHTFHHPINLEYLYVRIEMDEDFFQVSFLSERNDAGRETKGKEVYIDEAKKGISANIELVSKYKKEIKSRAKIVFMNSVSVDVVWEYVYENIAGLIFDVTNGKQDKTLFIPASRTGMLLLYKYFFSEKENGDRMDIIKYQGNNDKKGNDLGLSEPVYDFLQFLLRYTPNQAATLENKEIIEFIQKHLLEGEIQQIGDETVYVPKGSQEHIPLYLSSSMINELAPLFKVLTGAGHYRRIFYDEIETCLHPLKQGEMARTLIRMNNIGYKMIVSTHSDTMANKINNLLLISKVDELPEVKNDKLRRMRLTEDDLLESDEFHIYQFVNNNDGTSEVGELEFMTTPLTGYNFNLFMDNINELYEETSTVME
jgi:predicted ATP-dependent endonuclease of OLD family